VKTSVLGTGSKGNSIFCELGNSKILIDVGLSYKQIKERLNLIGESPENIDFILVSHEHQDHTKGLDVFLRHHKIKFYIQKKSSYILKNKIENYELGIPLNKNEMILGKNFQIKTFPLKHDSLSNSGFLLKDDSGSMLILYDTGEIPENLVDKVSDINILVIETNHDVNLLLGSRYPWHLKKRITSEKGHLSNEQSFDFANNLIERGTTLKYIVPVHISEENNHIDLINKLFNSNFLKKNNLNLVKTYPDHPSEVIKL
jgi:phosphoribosyl 1,2-cyclic phosphodiesterase